VITRAAPVDSLLWQAIAEHRFSLVLIALFAVGAVLLAAVGLYSVIAQSLQQRRKELAVRSALGATAWRLGGIALRDGVVMAAIGLVLGGMLAATVLRLAPDVLYSSAPAGPSVFVAATLAVALAVAAALFRPVLLAATIELNRVLREE